jgi:hypothetical protein
VMEASLPCWRRRLESLDPCGVTGSPRLVVGSVVEGSRHGGTGCGRWLGVQTAASNLFVVTVLWGCSSLETAAACLRISL